MACCYIAASMIGLIVKTMEFLDLDMHVQYNESVKHNVDMRNPFVEEEHNIITEDGVTTLSLYGMTCAACTNNIELVLKDVLGVNQVLVSLPLKEARIFHEPDIETQKLVMAVCGAGYHAEIGERSTSHKIDVLRHSQELERLRTSIRGLGLWSMLIFGLGKGPEWLGLSSYISQFPTLLSVRSTVLFGLTIMAVTQYGTWVFSYATVAALQGHVNMHTLISASTVVSIVLTFTNLVQGNQESQYFDSILGILLIVTVGRYMDLLSRRRATDTFEGLHTMLNATKRVKLARINKHVPSSIVREGDIIIVDAYTMVPCDCYIIEGDTCVNEAIITGESCPKAKGVGSLLLAGSRNGSNQVKAAVHQDSSGSFLSQLIKSIEASLVSKPAAQKKVDIVMQYFVSSIFIVAIIASIATFLRTRNTVFDQAINATGLRLMTVLTAACPCAVGLATPCAIMAGIDVAWRNGILMLEGGETMEAIKQISHVVMDKTGTLTRGAPTVCSTMLDRKWKGHEKQLAVLICAAEEKAMASHPLAMAVFRKMLPQCEEQWSKFKLRGSLRDIVEVCGRGVRCAVNVGEDHWKRVCIGNFDFMRDNHIKGVDIVAGSSRREGSIVLVGIVGELAASLLRQDTPRPDAIDTVQNLRQERLDVSMLTGDNPQEAARIAKELGIPVMASSATPEMKLQHVTKLQHEGYKFMMIGDGMNDGPSLAAADVGIMMAHGRTCLSSGGSVLILQSRLQALPTLIDISQSTMRQISFNITWALTYNVIAVALAVGLGEPIGLTISPSIAATMTSFSSIFITVQGLLLRMRLSLRHSRQD